MFILMKSGAKVVIIFDMQVLENFEPIFVRKDA